MPVLATHKLSIGYTKKGKINTVQTNLNLNIKSGELVCLIGPNGVGKSTLIRTMTGLQKPLEGEISIHDININKLTNREKSLYFALVLTDRINIENATVHDIVAFGRHPHSDWWGRSSEYDEQRINESIEMVHLSHKKDCLFNELSDGESQKVLIAKALAQDTDIVLLDEPTAHLDLPNRVEIMLLLHKLAHSTGKCIILSTHELDMALQAADIIWLMHNDGIKYGVPEDLVLNGDFNEVFKSELYYFNESNGNFSMNYPLKHAVSIEGDKTRMYWTLRALARAGYRVIPDSDSKITVKSEEWILNNKKISSIKELLEELEKNKKPTK